MENKEYQLEQDRVLKIYRDDNAESPDTWGNTDMFLVYDHRQFTVKRKGFDPEDIAEWYQASFRTLEYDGYFVFPVAAYIHSEIVLNLTSSLNRLGWDTSVAGFILINKEKVVLNKININKTNEQIAKEYAEGLIETWNQYLSGDVWGFKVFKKVKYYKISEEGIRQKQIIFPSDVLGETPLIKVKDIKENENIELEEEDSCWGFYGSDPKTNGMLDHIDYKLIENEK